MPSRWNGAGVGEDIRGRLKYFSTVHPSRPTPAPLRDLQQLPGAQAFSTCPLSESSPHSQSSGVWAVQSTQRSAICTMTSNVSGVQLVAVGATRDGSQQRHPADDGHPPARSSPSSYTTTFLVLPFYSTMTCLYVCLSVSLPAARRQNSDRGPRITHPTGCFAQPGTLNRVGDAGENRRAPRPDLSKSTWAECPVGFGPLAAPARHSGTVAGRQRI